MNQRPVIVLTGGPGGGKSTLLDELRRDPWWVGRFVALPETVHCAAFTTVSPQEKLFQRVMVHLQLALEDGLKSALGNNDRRVLICHRGSLDPLAFWRQRGWPEAEFFTFVGYSRVALYARYAAVIHLVTAADGASHAYKRWPEAHRPEEAAEAIRLDGWLHEAWRDHPAYFRLDNTGRDWVSKSRQAQEILAHFC